MRVFTVTIYSLIFYGFTLSSAFAQTDTTQRIEPGRRNSQGQQQKPYVILISADGFRYDFATKYNATFLQSMKKKGVSSPYMQPSFPSLTFPNHYTLVTGLYPSHHGLIGNSFQDPENKEWYSKSKKEAVTAGKWYGGTPLWVLAEQQQMVSASFYWAGSEADIKGLRPTYWYPYNEKISMDRRIATVVKWLKLPEEQRPHLITFYLPEVDNAGHDFGPDSKEVEDAVSVVDSAVRKLTEEVAKTGLPVNFIFVSDHGLTKVNNENPIKISEIPADTTKYTISGSGTMVEVFVKNKGDVNAVYDKLKHNAMGYKVYTKYNTPSYWHFSTNDDVFGRIADILLEPQCPEYFSDKKAKPGAHGYDPVKVKDMRAIFIAWGPAFKSSLKIRAFENVHIYPLIVRILGLNMSEEIDGRRSVLENTLNARVN
ncbi:alkaline phosphatase family protein [Pararcticibacter amylolyticus]|uniref:Alkaline phosphatase family protein n=1 Tax=Pararcticibacter amylolyticus TaxID=2173175 RepID=A0A2U2PH51_9SPHI|nr:ectonucleotide pyrophosphatase/phosphodiesterase [Pararcticibacter amylolyticus]PWG80745.1 alkaline phosphatase family protein [Pararcticibacter amylolyticus]